MDSNSPTQMTPDDVADRRFRTRFRGLDATEVEEHLNKVAEALKSLRQERADQEAEIVELNAKIAELEASSLAEIEEIDLGDPELFDRLEPRTREMIEDARARAADERERAEEEAADIIAQAEQIYAERSQIADEETARIRSEMNVLREQRLAEIDSEASTSREAAERELTARAEEAEVARAEAEAEAHRLVEEAQIIRRQILEDLARRRSSARRQIEQLRAGRDRLLASHDVVRRTLAEVTEELTTSMTEARGAAETAGRAVAESTVEELEAEIETARLSGLLDTGPLPVISTTPQAPLPAAAASAVGDEATPDEGPPDDISDGAEALEADQADDAPTDPSDERASPEDEHREPDPSADTPEAATEEGENDEAEPAAELAPVLDLDSARQDVDTGSHPAARRKASGDEEGQTDQDLTSVDQGGDVVDPEEDLDVDALFARMRSSREKEAEEIESPGSPSADQGDQADETEAADGPSGEKPSKKKSAKGAKTKAAKKADKGDKPTDADEPDKTPDVDVAAVVADLSRQLKRVLADEQSAVLSKLRSGKKPKDKPSSDDVMEAGEQHRERYWVIARTAAADAIEAGDDQLDHGRGEIDSLVTGLRTRVSKAIDDADDSDAAIEELRKIYRDVKTRHIGEHAESFCESVIEAVSRDSSAAE